MIAQPRWERPHNSHSRIDAMAGRTRARSGGTRRRVLVCSLSTNQPRTRKILLLMIAIDPMRFAVVCDGCRAREEIDGARTAVIEHLLQRSWRVTEEGKTTSCTECAGPPSVFPSATLTKTAERCSACGVEVDVCVACRMEFAPSDVISCRGEFGHAHARCSTQKFRKLVPPEG
jgi:hypothetical protein